MAKEVNPLCLLKGKCVRKKLACGDKRIEYIKGFRSGWDVVVRNA